MLLGPPHARRIRRQAEQAGVHVLPDTARKEAHGGSVTSDLAFCCCGIIGITEPLVYLGSLLCYGHIMNCSQLKLESRGAFTTPAGERHNRGS